MRVLNYFSSSARAGTLGSLIIASLCLGGCAGTGGIENASGVPASTVDPSVRGPVEGLGIEGHDIISMTDQMLRDMLADSNLAGRNRAPRVIIDAKYFVNDSSQPIDKNSITDRLMVQLNRAAHGRMIFVGRNYAGMVEHERELKRNGVTDIGTTGLTKAQLGADFRLGGRITSLDSRDTKSGMEQRYTQITFEMVDLESGEIVWSGIYEFSRVGADDVVYR